MGLLVHNSYCASCQLSGTDRTFKTWWKLYSKLMWIFDILISPSTNIQQNVAMWKKEVRTPRTQVINVNTSAGNGCNSVRFKDKEIFISIQCQLTCHQYGHNPREGGEAVCEKQPEVYLVSQVLQLSSNEQYLLKEISVL